MSLPERKARGCSYNRAKRTAKVEVGSGGGAARETSGTALVDARGGLVGVDVEPDSAARAVVLMGRHEDVATTRDVRLTVSRDGAGEVVWVVVHDFSAP